MSKRTWMKIHNGLLEPKHREALGVRVWLYLHMIDRAQWDTGIIDRWVDSEEAEALEMPVSTLRRQRKELDEMGYITAAPAFQCQTITIHKWRNPREVLPEQLNPVDEGVPKSGDPPIKVSTHPATKVSTPTIDSQKDHINPLVAGATELSGDPPLGLTPVPESPADNGASKQAAHTAFKNAIMEGVYGFKYPADKDRIPASAWGPVQQWSLWWRGQANSSIQPPEGVTPEKIVSFYAWFRESYPDMEVPTKYESIVANWVKWEIALAQQPPAPSGPRTLSLVEEL